MKRLLIIPVVAALAVLILALPASAQIEANNPEADRAYLADLIERWAPPGTPPGTTGVWGWNPYDGSYGWQPLYWLAGYCTNAGGYYYEAADRAAYWNAC